MSRVLGTSVLRLLRSRIRPGASRSLLQEEQQQHQRGVVVVAGGNAFRVSARELATPVMQAGEREHTAKWMTNYDRKTPQDLIREVPPIEVRGRVIACEGGRDPSLGHPVEYICVDLPEPVSCKYCGLRYVQAHHHHH